MKGLLDKNSHDLSRMGLVLAIVLLCVVRLLLAAQGRLFLEPENAPIDDQLMYTAARSVTAGQWLGPYAYNTIGKHMFFAVWLAGAHWLGVPYLVANALLHLLGSWVTASALFPVLKKRLWVLAAFFLLAYCPVGFDQYNYRIYRDSITVALMLLALGGFAGLVLRLDAPRRKTAWVYSVVGGLGLGASWLNREDGVWLLPFCCCLVVLGGWAFCKAAAPGARWKALAAKLPCLGLPFALLAACLALYAGVNKAYYGRFIVSDLTSRDFTTAYGLLAGIEDEGTGACRPVTRATRQLLYQNSAFFAELEPYWESPVVLNGYGSKESGEYNGSYYYALRLCNALAGQYQDALETQRFYEQMAQELRCLEQQGVIRITAFHRSTVPFWRGAYLTPTLQELGNGLQMSVFCTTFDPGPRFSVYSKQEMVDEICAYVKGDIVKGYREGSDQPYYNPLQRAAFLLEKLLCWLWRAYIVVALAAALWWAVAGCRQGFGVLFGRRGADRADAGFWRWVLIWGTCLSALLRCALMAYMEATVFHIGTYLMYLSTAVPLWGLAGLLGLRQAVAVWTKRGPAPRT